jgi:hypothetical protein
MVCAAALENFRRRTGDSTAAKLRGESAGSRQGLGGLAQRDAREAPTDRAQLIAFQGYSQDKPKRCIGDAVRQRAGLHSSLRASNVEPQNVNGVGDARVARSSSASIASWWVGLL